MVSAMNSEATCKYPLPGHYCYMRSTWRGGGNAKLRQRGFEANANNLNTWPTRRRSIIQISHCPPPPHTISLNSPSGSIDYPLPGFLFLCLLRQLPSMRFTTLLALGCYAAIVRADLADDAEEAASSVSSAAAKAASSAESVVESVTSSAVEKPTFTVSPASLKSSALHSIGY